MTLKKTLLSFLFPLILSVANAQVTSIQFINNSADQALAGITLYINGQVVTPGLGFRNATPFINVPAGQPITIAVSDMNGTIADTFYSITTTLSTNPVIKYIAVANGMISTSGYSPLKKFSLSIFNLGKDVSSLPNYTDVVFAHGCTDAPIVYDMRSGAKTLANDLAYDQFSADYVPMPAANYPIRMTNASGSQVFKTYITHFDSNPDFVDKTTVIVLSGFMNPSANSNGPKFGLWAATVNGGPLQELDTTVPEAIARIQIAHNSADTALDSVDLYINNELRYDNFAFRTATPYIDFVAKVNSNISIAKKNSTSVADTFYSFDATFDSTRRYLAIINGVVSNGYKPKPADKPVHFMFFGNAQEEAGTPNTNILAINGSIDVPDYNIVQGTNVIANNLFYDNIPGYTTVGPTDEVYVVKKLNGDTIERYDAQVKTLDLAGLAVTLLGSGFYDTASNNLPRFWLYWVLPSGGPFIRLPISPTGVEVLSKKKDLFTVWPNPAKNVLYLNGDINFEKTTAYIYNVAGSIVKTIPVITGKRIDISELNSGIYFLKVASGNEYGYQKFIKE